MLSPVKEERNSKETRTKLSGVTADPTSVATWDVFWGVMWACFYARHQRDHGLWQGNRDSVSCIMSLIITHKIHFLNQYQIKWAFKNQILGLWKFNFFVISFKHMNIHTPSINIYVQHKYITVMEKWNKQHTPQRRHFYLDLFYLWDKTCFVF